MTGNILPLFSGLLSASILIMSPPLARAGYEPFVTWYYAISWYSLILFVDSVRSVCGKQSFIFRRPHAFAALVFWSAVIWFLFEAFNFRLADWYYVFVPDSRWERIIGSWLSFGTVLPAIFLIEKLMYDFGVFVSGPFFSFSFFRKRCKTVVLAGAACLVLPLVFPRYAFPLIWAWGFLLPLPLVLRRVELLALEELDSGRPGRILRILLAGVFCGFFWEFLNFFARTRWIYTVPYLEEIKLFEMPPLGFLGFPLFALECTVLYAFLVGFGMAPGIDGLKRRAGMKPAGPLPAALISLAALCMGFFVLHGMEVNSIDSYTPRPGGLSLPEQVHAFVEKGGYDDCFKLKGSFENPGVRAMFKQEGVDVEKVMGLIDLSVLRGIGTVHAESLSALGVKNVSDLKSMDPDLIAEALSKGGSEREIRIRRARVNVWIRAAARESQR